MLGRQNNFGFSAADTLARYKEDRGGPGGEQVKARNEFDNECREESPVPSEKTGKDRGNREIEGGVGHRQATLAEQWPSGQLKEIGSHGNQPGPTMPG